MIKKKKKEVHETPKYIILKSWKHLLLFQSKQIGRKLLFISQLKT